jgi:ribose transport system ATP-binding protein
MAPLLRAGGLSKRFGAVRALDDVDFEIAAGEIVGLVGANGAGKSTLMRVIGGVTRPDAGELEIGGEPLSLASPRDASKAGLALVPQESSMNLVPGQSVADNIFLGRPLGRGGFMRDRRLKAESRKLLAVVGLDGAVTPEATVSSLTPIQQRLVSIAQALSVDPRVLILDEPTAALPTETARGLQPVVRNLAASGTAVIYISHRLQEICDLSDRVVAMREGRIAGALPRQEVTIDKLVQLIGGRDLEQQPVQEASEIEQRAGAVVVRVSGMGGRRVQGVDLEVRAGEIVGIGGLQGSGRSELMRLLAGVQPISEGEVEIDGGRRCRSPHDAAERGVGYLPESRAQMIFPKMTLQRNLTVTVLPQLSRLFVNRRAERERSKELIERLAIKGTPGTPIQGLSGGNQQKAFLGRWLLHDAKILLLDEPTVGVDVHARAEIHRILRGLADEQGTAIVVASSEPEELVLLCDRVAIMVEGQVRRELRAPFDADTVVALSYAREPLAAGAGG